MKLYHLDEMQRGWFVGSFNPAAYNTNDVDVGFKEYAKGDYEPPHHHKIATEITLVTSGSALFNFVNKKEIHLLKKGDIIVIEPGEVVAFSAIEDCSTVVVKIPGILDDKYINLGTEE